MIANPEDVEAPGQLAEQLAAAGFAAAGLEPVDVDPIAALEAVADAIALRVAEQLGAGMVSGTLPAWVGDVLAEAHTGLWHMPPASVGHHVIQFTYEPRPQARELVLTLGLDGQRIWTAVLKADRAG